jgi:uncharacterized protein (TIGR02145 family)
MAENLNYAANSSVCYGYENNAEYCAKYGRLYNWITAMAACPEGWHLPSDVEWTTLTDYVGGSSRGKKLKSKDGWEYWSETNNGTDDFGFSALPGGKSNGNGVFQNAGREGDWWSATEYRTGTWRRYMEYSNDGVYRDSNGNKTYLFSVRCVEN